MGRMAPTQQYMLNRALNELEGVKKNHREMSAEEILHASLGGIAGVLGLAE